MDFESINKGKLRLCPNYFNIREALQELIDIFQYDLSKKGIKLKLCIDKNIPLHIYNDKKRIK